MFRLGGGDARHLHFHVITSCYTSFVLPTDWAHNILPTSWFILFLYSLLIIVSFSSTTPSAVVSQVSYCPHPPLAPTLFFCCCARLWLHWLCPCNHGQRILPQLSLWADQQMEQKQEKINKVCCCVEGKMRAPWKREKEQMILTCNILYFCLTCVRKETEICKSSKTNVETSVCFVKIYCSACV